MYRWMSKMQWLLGHVDERTIAQVWSRVKHENLELTNEQVADKVEGYFRMRTASTPAPISAAGSA
jgi:hypothetical protein